MSTYGPKPDTVAHYERLAAWALGPEGVPDDEQIVITAATAHLLDQDGHRSRPIVEIRVPGDPPQVWRVDVEIADPLAEHLHMAADVAREGTTP